MNTPGGTSQSNKGAVRRLQAQIDAINATVDLLPCSTQSGSYTLTTADAATCVEFTSSSGVNCTIPPNSSEDFPVGAWVQIRQFGTGQVTIVAGSGAVTLRSPAGAVKTCQQYVTVVAHQRATDDWVLAGDLV